MNGGEVSGGPPGGRGSASGLLAGETSPCGTSVVGVDVIEGSRRHCLMVVAPPPDFVVFT